MSDKGEEISNGNGYIIQNKLIIAMPLAFLKKVCYSTIKAIENKLNNSEVNDMKETKNETFYKVTLTENQARVVQTALEEYFRLRMGQEMQFCMDFASLGVDLSPENPRHEKIFDLYIARRDHLEEVMRAFFRIAFEPIGYLQEKTDDMMIAECIWDAIRFARGKSRWSSLLHIGSEPTPPIEKTGGVNA